MNKSEIKQACIAMMYGDAYTDTNFNSGRSRLDLYHSEKQRDYLEWKNLILSNVVETYLSEKIDQRPLKNNNTRKGWRLHTRFCRYLFSLKQAPTKFLVKQLVKPLALSILWQDDGTICWDKKGGYSTAYLYTDSWDREELKIFLKEFNNQYGWCPVIMDYKCRGKTYPRLRFKKNEMEKLSGIIKSYIQPSMMYKIIS